MPAERIFPLVVLLVFAFAANLPLGYLREKSRRFSLHWFVLVHFSIPFIVVLRSYLGFSWRWIPLTLGCAVAGQLIGGRAKRKMPL